MTCVHTWNVETPTGGPTSLGVCSKCGVEREFANSFGEDRTRTNNNDIFNTIVPRRMTPEEKANARAIRADWSWRNLWAERDAQSLRRSGT